MGRPAYQALRILVLDDNLLLGGAICRCFARTGHAARFAAEAGEAARLAEETRFDVGVFDIELGSACGLSLAAAWLAAGRIPAIVFFSAITDYDRKRMATALGTLVPKDADFRALLAAVVAAAEAHRGS